MWGRVSPPGTSSTRGPGPTTPPWPRCAGPATGRPEAVLLAEFGQLRYEQDRFAEARTYYAQALAAFREVADVRGEAATLAAIGTTCRDQGYLLEALHFLGQAHAVLSDLHDAAATASVDRVTGSVRLERGDFPGAHADLKAALAGFRRLDSRRGEGLTLRTISLLLRRAEGDYSGRTTWPSRPGRSSTRSATTCSRPTASGRWRRRRSTVGQPEAAAAALPAVLGTCRAAPGRWGEALDGLRTLGELHLGPGPADRGGRPTWEAALSLWQAMGSAPAAAGANGAGPPPGQPGRRPPPTQSASTRRRRRSLPPLRHTHDAELAAELAGYSDPPADLERRRPG